LSFAPASSFIDPTPGRSKSFASSMRHATGSALNPTRRRFWWAQARNTTCPWQGDCSWGSIRG
jgi:hypothetical protein